MWNTVADMRALAESTFVLVVLQVCCFERTCDLQWSGGRPLRIKSTDACFLLLPSLFRTESGSREACDRIRSGDFSGLHVLRARRSWWHRGLAATRRHLLLLDDGLNDTLHVPSCRASCLGRNMLQPFRRPGS